ncbi:MAG TPA: heterodisulfide reductase-related iron-sulfur binding cluster [Actinomycetes bacterium]|jgi:Fe-S oxidoreductase|nr:heterodisulfide reductase-related iron-sulfur binding cluster [Actinomycetes bacterium]
MQAGGEKRAPRAGYSSFFRRVQDMKKLQTRPDQASWLERYCEPTRSYDVVLYLGCNILRTPDIARQAVRVFEALGVDFIAVAGVQFCCGIPWGRAGERDQGERIGARTLARLGSYQPSTLVFWCPSCDVHFADAVLGGPTLPCERLSAAEYLARRAERNELAWRREVRARVALHAHEGRADHAAGRRRAFDDRRAVSRLLEAIPGVEFDAVVSSPELDYDCGIASVGLPRERFLALRGELVAQARSRGADTLATISHACQREWCDAADEALAIRNYVGLVGEALGLPVEEDLLQRLKRSREPDAVLRESEVFWRSHGLSEEEARTLVLRYFGRSAPMVP